MRNFEYIRWIGRTYTNIEEAAKYFYFTASGFETTFKGTMVKATFKSSKYDIPDKMAYLVALIDTDDPFAKENRTYAIDEAKKEIVIANLENRKHTIKFLKRSEASDSSLALLSIETDGRFIMCDETGDFKMQFIAASSSTGYGNLGNLSTAKSTGNSDGLKGFAYLTSYMLGAEVDIFAASGWGVTRGWNTGGRISETENIPEAYDYIAITDQNTIDRVIGKWDHFHYTPDVVVVNLGTNDFNSCGYENMTEEEKEKMETVFVTRYADFIHKLADLFPKVHVIVAYGLMGDAAILEAPTARAVALANTRIGFERAYLFLMEAAGSNGNQFGSDYHPNVGTGINVARSLAFFISRLSGRKIINEIK